jgi:hypothetical protein
VLMPSSANPMALLARSGSGTALSGKAGSTQSLAKWLGRTVTQVVTRMRRRSCRTVLAMPHPISNQAEPLHPPHLPLGSCGSVACIPHSTKAYHGGQQRPPGWTR